MPKNSLVTSLRPGQAWAVPAALLAGLSFPLAALAADASHGSHATGDAALTQTLTASSGAANFKAAKSVSGWVSVILKTTGPMTAAQEAQLTALGGDIVRRLPIIQSVAVRVPRRSLQSLAALPFAAHLSLDGQTEKTDGGKDDDNETTLQYGFSVNSSGAAAAFQQYGYTGKGVTVAVLDSGIMPVADLNGSAQVSAFSVSGQRILANVNFAPAAIASAPGMPVPPQQDPCGHGTHVAGIIAGNGTKSTDKNSFLGFFGIAPSANLVNVRVLDQNGTTSVSTVITGLQWVIANKLKYNIRVVNLSLGHPVGESYITDPLCQAVEAAYRAGIVVVCAAGNSGRISPVSDPTQDNEGWGTAYGSIQSPANDPYVITVGATKSVDGVRADDRIATYSSRGPSRLDLVMKPDIIAPGNKVISLTAGSSLLYTYAGGSNTIPQSLYRYIKKGDVVSSDYFQLSGTSMAAPVVAGAAAILLQANPKLTPDTVKARLMLSADKWLDPAGNADPLTYGAGYLDIPAALASTATAWGPAASPSVAVDSQGNVSIVMDRAVWGTTLLGPTLWGTGVTDLRAVWGTHAVWGSGGVTDLRAVWGTNAISATRAVGGSSVWADRAVWGSSGSAVDLTSTAITGE